MASSLIGGLVATGHKAEHILVAEPNEARRDWLVKEHGVVALADSAAVAAQVDILVIAVKPDIVPAVLAEIGAPARVRRPIVVSIAAGVTLTRFRAALGEQVSVVRAMPNTPALIRAGITGVFAPPGLSAEQKRTVNAVLSAVGEVHWFARESDLDIVTALSGSGPAYFFYLMEAMQNAGISLGLSPADAQALVTHTALGAARLALKSAKPVSQLRAEVTSPGGTTERAIQTLDARDVDRAIADAVKAASARASELA